MLMSCDQLQLLHLNLTLLNDPYSGNSAIISTKCGIQIFDAIETQAELKWFNSDD